jgi:hypothetical protein
VFPAGNTIGASQRLKFLAVICAALLQLPVAAPRHLKLPVFCRNMHPLLRHTVLKHYPLSVELRIHSTSSSSTSNGGRSRQHCHYAFLPNLHSFQTLMILALVQINFIIVPSYGIENPINFEYYHYHQSVSIKVIFHCNPLSNE